MKKPTSSLILSPNLGCPEIVSVPALKGNGFRLIIAAPHSEDFDAAHSLKARPSFNGGGGEDFALEISSARKLEDEALPEHFGELGETRLLISTTLRAELFPDHDFWEVRAKPGPRGEENGDPKYLRTVENAERSTLYDLELSLHGTVVGHVKHALCLRVGGREVKFVHLTDLHVAARNDMWQTEVPAVIEGSPVTPGPQNFQNFNNRLRKFIDRANGLADKGELDFIWALGDLVDFCRTGLFERTADDSNWPALIEILTGSAAEGQRGNYGLRVPIFTTSGNHDWRTYPYSPVITRGIFGITKDCAKELDFWYRNTSVEIGKKLEEVQQKLITRGSPLLARSWWGAIVSMGLRGIIPGFTRLRQRTSAVLVKYSRQLLASPVWLAAIVALAKGSATLKSLLTGQAWCKILWQVVCHPVRTFCHDGFLVAGIVLLLLALAVTFVLPSSFYNLLRGLLEGLISIEADVSTVSEYLLRVNPYFNYAFELGSCRFIVLDTGPDCLTAQSFWDDGGKKVRRISISDNILGGSPDTMGFYPANEFYPYSQIAWLEKVLSCIGPAEQQPPERRVFVGLHAPPANLSPNKRDDAEGELCNQTAKRSGVLMKKSPIDGCDALGGYDIRYGTVNHYLSQFFYLCLGCREAERNKPFGPGVDAVFAGHAHWNMEFKLCKPEKASPEWAPDVWYGRFSEQVESECQGKPDARWGPLLLQTAACGPQGRIADEVPPNYRYVTVGADGAVCNLRPYTLNNPP